MKRDYKFDVARVVCMTLIVTYIHLYAYIHPEVKSANFIPAWAIITDACLGLFTFVSGYLIGKKYSFGMVGNYKVGTFYKKRILRIIPLFIIASVALWLIEFNGSRATLNGLFCISPFVKPRPMTLWYIPVILFCYLITPMVSRNDLKWRVGSSVVVMMALVLVSKLVPSTDSRLLFNVFFYLGGAISSQCSDLCMKIKNGENMKMAVMILFMLLLVIGQMHANFHARCYRWLAAGFGVFAILFVCEQIANLLFGRENETSMWRLHGRWIVSYVSYASMACYMFHRLFFWIGEKLYNPGTDSVKWLYMGALVFPVMIVLSYYIQRYYDLLIKKV